MMGSNGSLACAAPLCDCCPSNLICPLSPAEKVTQMLLKWPYMAHSHTCITFIEDDGSAMIAACLSMDTQLMCFIYT